MRKEVNLQKIMMTNLVLEYDFKRTIKLFVEKMILYIELFWI